jgi:hypothetical protein
MVHNIKLVPVYPIQPDRRQNIIQLLHALPPEFFDQHLVFSLSLYKITFQSSPFLCQFHIQIIVFRHLSA